MNLGDAVEILDVFLSPFVRQLRSSLDLVVLPSVQYRDEFAAVSRCSSSCIHDFDIIGLSWIIITCFLS